MNSTILNGYSGIKTHQFGVDSISNNISNVNTNGYRANVPQFSTIFATHLDFINSSSPVSNDFEHGSTVASNAINTTDGTYVNADGSPFNMALGGKGWFVVGKDKEGSFDIGEGEMAQNQKNFFTRDGAFLLDSEAYLTTSSGQYVYGVDLGKIADDGTFTLSLDEQSDTQNLSSSLLQPIKIPQQINAIPTLTTKVDVALNLSRERGLDSVDNVFKNEDGSFDEVSFRENDFNTLYNSADQSIDIIKDSTISISVANDGEEPTLYNFTYGEDFKTVGEFIDTINEQTGLSVEVSKDGSCALTIKNITKAGEDPVNKIVQFSSEKENRIISLLGITAAPTSLIPDSDGSFMDSYALKVPTYKTNITVFDKDGNDYLMQSVYRLKDYGNQNNDIWEVSTAIYTRDMEYKISNESAKGTLSFNPDGEASYVGDTDVNFDDNNIKFNPTGAAGSATTNRLYADSGVVKLDKDGNSSGQLKDIAIDENGIIYLQFSNNITEPMGRIGIAGFVNDQGLRKVGSNMFEMIQHNIDGEGKIVSGPPMVMWDEANGQLKQSIIMQGKLETSNVDLGTALTQLIVMQRGYSANAKSFTTGDELLKEAIGLKR